MGILRLNLFVLGWEVNDPPSIGVNLPQPAPSYSLVIRPDSQPARGSRLNSVTPLLDPKGPWQRTNVP
jgi:hypothetical protein